MDEARWQTVQDLFDAALEWPRGERLHYLRDAAGGDEELIAEVVSLLEADAASDGLFEGLALDALGVSDDSLLEHAFGPHPGQLIGPWRIRDQLGRGGMGAVYLAERADGNFRQQAALKLLKRGMDTDEIVRRFRSERQILAQLQHPNIARLLDGGVTDDGLPYFAMEYVDGVPLDEYCATHRLSLKARLRLFHQICLAVQYAHRNLVVHRDLKPSNILITSEGVPKLLDFGIAKVLRADTDETAVSTNLTVTGFRVMTPEYASPEQVRGETVTTASDIYSLGVVLYELLTGVRPYEPASPSPQDMERAILEAEPARPSTAIRRQPDVDAQRKAGLPAGPGRLMRRLRGDLDMICLKALRKEPERRYASAEQLGDDVRRFLHGLPVMARGDGVVYRAHKFVERHRTGVLLVGVFVALLVGLVWFYTTQLARQRDRAMAEAARAEQMTRLTRELFVTPFASEPPEPAALVRQAEERVARRLEGQHAQQAALWELLANLERSLERPDRAAELYERSLAARRQAAMPADDQLLGTLLALGQTHLDVEAYGRAAVVLAEATRLAESGTAPPELHAGALIGLAQVAAAMGQGLDAEVRYRAASGHLEAAEAGPASRAEVLLGWADVAQRAGRWERADSLLKAASALLGEVPSGRADPTGRARLLLARSRLSAARGDVAQALREARAAQDGTAAGTRIHAALQLQQARLYALAGDPEAAQRAARQAIVELDDLHRPTHPDVLAAVGLLADVQMSAGAYEAARSMLRDALAALDRSQESRAAAESRLVAALARVAEAEGRSLEAEQQWRQSLDLMRRALPPNHPDLAEPLLGLGGNLLGRGNARAAQPLLAEGIAIVQEASLVPTEQRLQAYILQAEAVRRTRSPEAAADMLRGAVGGAVGAVAVGSAVDTALVLGLLDPLIKLRRDLGQSALADSLQRVYDAYAPGAASG